jgi:zinc D-Ala-D-Ala carboxypeptidase
VKLSTHFRLAEFEFSATATRHGIPNAVPERLMPNLMRLVGMLEQVRQIAGGQPLRITSGYRNAQINRLVRGSDNSAHMDARAADFTIPAYGSPLDLCELIAESGIEFDQLIHEYGAWVHLGIAREGVAPRRQTLTIDRTGTRPGLHRVIA